MYCKATEVIAVNLLTLKASLKVLLNHFVSILYCCIKNHNAAQIRNSDITDGLKGFALTKPVFNPCSHEINASCNF